MAAGTVGISSAANSRELYQNWIKGGLGLNIVKEGITPYVINEVESQHANFIKSISVPTPCTSCVLRKLQPDHTFQKAGNTKLCPLGMKKCLCLGKNQVPCPNNICGKLHDEIVKAHRFLDPNWGNTDITKWVTDFWEVAKCFINSGGYADKTSAEDTDCSGLLSIVINNGTFPFTISTVQPLDTFSQISNLMQTFKKGKMRIIRNDIMHSANLEIDDADLKLYLAEINKLLGMVSNLGVSSTSSAVSKLKSIQAAVMMSSEVEKTLRMKTLTELLREKGEALREIATRKEDITGIVDRSVSVVKRSHESSYTAINEKMEESFESLQTKRDNISKEVDTISERATAEIKSKGQQTSSEIIQLSTNVAAEIKKKTDDTLEKLREANDKTTSRLDSIQDELQNEQGNIELLTNITDAVEKEQKYIKEKIVSLEQEVSSIKKTVDAIDKAITLHKERLAYLESKEELRNDLCQFYKENYYYVPVTSEIKRPVGTIDDMFFELTETEPDFFEVLLQEQYQRKDAPFVVCEKAEIDHGYVLDGNTYTSIFFKKKHNYKNIVITGAKNSGKSTWCWNLLFEWVNACSKVKCNDQMGSLSDQNGESVLEESGLENKNEKSILETFDIVLYIPLINLSQFKTVPDLIKHNTESPFFQNEDKLTKLEDILRSKDSKCLIVLDDLHILNENALIRNPAKQGLENCFYISTSFVNAYLLPDFEVVQFDRYVSIKCVPNIKTLHSSFLKIFSERQMSEGKTSFDNAEQIRKVLIDSSHLGYSAYRPFHFSDLPVFIVFIILNWHLSGQIGETLSVNYASALDCILQLAGNEKTGNFEKLTNYESYRYLCSGAKSKLPDCFKNLTHFKKYACLILKLAKAVFQAQCGAGNDGLNADERLLLYRMGMLVDKTSHSKTTGKIYFEEYQIHECSFPDFLSALHLVVSTRNTNDDSPLCAFEQLCDTYDKLMQKKRILYFVSGMDPKIASSLSFRLYQCLKYGEETAPSFHNPFETCTQEIVSYSAGFPNAQYPIFTTTVRLSGIFGKTIWKCNYNIVKDVHLDSKEIQIQDLHSLKQSRNIQTIHWLIPDANMETYQLDEVANVLSSLHFLTVIALSGVSSDWTPNCEKTQDLDLSNCVHLQHLSFESMSYRNIYVNASSLVSIFVDNIRQCSIKIGRGVIDKTQEYNSKGKVVHRSALSKSPIGDGEIDPTRLANKIYGAKISDPDVKEGDRNQYGILTESDRKENSESSNRNSSKAQSHTVSDETFSKLIYIRCNLMEECKLQYNDNPKVIFGVILKECKKSDVVINCPFNEAFSDVLESKECRIKSVALFQCSFTRLIYYVEKGQTHMEEKTCVTIDSLEYEQNEQSGFHSNISVSIKEAILQGLLDDLETESPYQSKCGDDIKAPKVDLSLDIANIPKISNVTLIESLAHMVGLKRLICKNLAWTLWEELGNALPNIDRLELFSVDNDKDLPVALFQNIKHIKGLTRLVVTGNWQGTSNEKGVSNKRKAGLKELATVLEHLHNVDFVDVHNLEIWPHISLACIGKAKPAVNTIACKLISQNEIETIHDVLLNLPKLNNLDLTCSVGEDVEELLLCLGHIKELKHVSCSGISFDESFPENISLIDLSHLESFKVDITNSWNDIPHVIEYIPCMANLSKLSIQAFLSELSWVKLASSLPQLSHLHTLELSSMPRRMMPVAIIESLLILKSLRKLTLNFHYMSEKEMNTAISRLGQLKVLEIVYKTLGEYADLSGLFKGMAKLVNLHELAIIVHRCKKARRYTELANVLPGLPNIKRLDLAHIVQTPSVLLSLKHMENLRHLYLPGLDVSGWLSLGHSLPHLSKLESLKTYGNEKPPPCLMYWKEYVEFGILTFNEENENDLTLFE